MAAIPISRAMAILAQRAPDEPIMIDGARVITRAAFDRNTNRLARALAGLGVGHGDFVSILLPNSVQFLETVVAAWKLGAVPQPLSRGLAPREAAEILALVRPRVIVGHAGCSAPGALSVPEGFVPDAALSDDAMPDIIAPHFKAMASGGSTGRPKVIVAGNPGTIDLDAPCPTVQPLERILVTGPLHHNAPFFATATSLLSGGCAVLMSRFDPEQVLAMIDRHRINFVTLVPTMMLRIWRLGPAVRAKYNLRSLRSVVHSASPCPVWLKESWIEWLGADRIVEAYSSTEAPGYTIIGGREWLAKKGSVGKADPAACEVMIADSDGRAVPSGTVGEVFMRPATGPDATYFFGDRYRYIGAEPRRLAAGWDSMGDLGYLDGDGYLFLCDRSTDLIIRGGANIYPAEVEAAIESHPMVRSCVVIGLPDEDLGETVAAVIETTEAMNGEEMRSYLKTRLSGHKIPAAMEFVDRPMRDTAGKVRRREVRDAWLTRRPADGACAVSAPAA